METSKGVTKSKSKRNTDFSIAFVRECKKVGLPSMEHNSQFLKNIKNGEVYVRSDRVQGREWDPFSNAIANDNSVRSITLYCDHVSQVGQQQRGRIPAIQEVGVSLRVCRGLAGCLAHSRVLTVLHLTNIFLTPENLKLLSNSLPQNNSLLSFGFVGCKIGDDGVAALYPGLQVNSSISSLEFVGCNLTDKAATRIAKLIQHHAIQRHTTHWITSLRTESSSPDTPNNNVTELERTHFEEYSLPTLPHVESGGLLQLNLSHNCIGDKGACALADAIKQDLWLQEINMKMNNIGLQGAQALKEALLENTCITALYLQDNKIDAGILGEIKSSMAINIDQKFRTHEHSQELQHHQQHILPRRKSTSPKKPTNPKLKQARNTLTHPTTHSAFTTPIVASHLHVSQHQHNSKQSSQHTIPDHDYLLFSSNSPHNPCPSHSITSHHSPFHQASQTNLAILDHSPISSASSPQIGYLISDPLSQYCTHQPDFLHPYTTTFLSSSGQSHNDNIVPKDQGGVYSASPPHDCGYSSQSFLNELAQPNIESIEKEELVLDLLEDELIHFSQILHKLEMRYLYKKKV